MADKNTDYHTLRAAEMFGVPQDAVTKEQRRAAKMDNYREAYSASQRNWSKLDGS